MRKISPRLWRDHPQFFILFFATAMFHLAIGVQLLVQPEVFDAPHYHQVKDLASTQAWGTVHLVVWALMTLGVYGNFSHARVGLVAGMMVVMVRGLLIATGDYSAGTSVPIYGLIAVLHYTQAGEPPINPVTMRS